MRKVKSNPSDFKGVTLIELMVVIAVLGVLALIAAPGMTDLLRSNRLSSQTNDVVSLLAYARGEAMRRGARVSVCPSPTGTSCSGSNWTEGLVVFADANRNGSLDSGEEVLRTMSALAGGNTLSASNGITTYVQFRGSGVATTTGRLKLCDSRPDQGRLIEIYPTGRMTTSRGVACP